MGALCKRPPGHDRTRTTSCRCTTSPAPRAPPARSGGARRRRRTAPAPSMRAFRTETTDFADAELLAVKEALGQVYVDVSKKLAPDDFARDLRKLRQRD